MVLGSLLIFLKEKNPVGYRGVFTVKYKADGSIDRYKTRLVAKAYTQIYEINIKETFAPMVKMNGVRVLLSLTTILDWPLQQLDVKNAFLNRELEEEVYMDLPLRFEGTLGGDKVCRLKRLLY
jgi:hypothetical protein